MILTLLKLQALPLTLTDIFGEKLFRVSIKKNTIFQKIFKPSTEIKKQVLYCTFFSSFLQYV